MKSINLILLSLLLTAPGLHADVKIIKIKGKVMFRPGLEENWAKAQTGAVLKNIDTILSGERGEVELELEDGSRFSLGANAILDIADIRKIQQRELFMYLMSQKIDNLEKADESENTKAGNVSIVHGQSKQIPDTYLAAQVQEDWYPLEINGALALYDHEYYPNTIIKFMKIQNKYGTERDGGEIEYYIGKSFEALNDPGQARDAYQRALNEVKNSGDSRPKWIEDARIALQRLEVQ